MRYMLYNDTFIIESSNIRYEDPAFIGTVHISTDTVDLSASISDLFGLQVSQITTFELFVLAALKNLNTKAIIQNDANS